MKIQVNQISEKGLEVKETISPVELDVATDIATFKDKISLKASVSRLTNTITLDALCTGVMYMRCSRCLEEFPSDFNKRFRFTYTVNSADRFIDVDNDIREEIILAYPLKPLCTPQCKGLCPSCGKNLNQGRCGCENGK